MDRDRRPGARTLTQGDRTHGSADDSPARVVGKQTLANALEPAVYQRKPNGEAGWSRGELEPVPGAGADGADGAGAPLPQPVQHKMEQSFGADFGGVRVFEGPEAPALGARAFARGDQLHFAPGEYAPSSTEGQSLIGHELTHVMQQRAGRVAAPQGKAAGTANSEPALEAEADTLGARAAQGERIEMGPVARFAAPDGVVQRELHPKAEAGSVGVHSYLPRDEKAPRGSSGGDEAAGGHYQHLGANIFRKVTSSPVGWSPDGTQLYYYYVDAGQLRTHTPRSAPGTTPEVWEPARATKGNSGGPQGRATADEHELRWFVPREMDSRWAEASALAAKIAGLKELTGDVRGWAMIRTLDTCPLQLAMHCPPDEAQAWSGRLPGGATHDVDTIWGQLVEAAGDHEKDSNDWQPVSHATTRKGRPTTKDFKVSASVAWRDKPNPKKTIEYEWCHLIGDGDGGSNRAANLVVGSSAANTVQLVVETVQRQFHKVCADNGLELSIRGRAALVPPQEGLKWQHDHCANWLRYTVLIGRKGEAPTPVVDHIYDGHREQISKGTVSVMIAQAQFLIARALETEFGVNPTAKITGAVPTVSSEHKGDIDAPSQQAQIVHNLKLAQGMGKLNASTVATALNAGYRPNDLGAALLSIVGEDAARTLVTQAMALLAPTSTAGSMGGGGRNAEQTIDDLPDDFRPKFLEMVDAALSGGTVFDDAKIAQLQKELHASFTAALGPLASQPTYKARIDAAWQKLTADFNEHARRAQEISQRKVMRAHPEFKGTASTSVLSTPIPAFVPQHMSMPSDSVLARAGIPTGGIPIGSVGTPTSAHGAGAGRTPATATAQVFTDQGGDDGGKKAMDDTE